MNGAALAEGIDMLAAGPSRTEEQKRLACGRLAPVITALADAYVGHVARALTMAVFMIGSGVAASHAQPAEQFTLVIFNHATEAVHVNVEEARCLEGASTLDGRLVLIERPRTAARLRVASRGECTANHALRLHITLTDLAGGTIGTIALEGSGEDIVFSAERAKNFVCTETGRAGPASAPVFTATFRICGS